MALVLVRQEERIGTIQLNHEARRNALSRVLIGELIHALGAFQEQDVRVAVLRAQPEARVWSAGHDVSELPKPGRDPLGYDDALEVALRAIQHAPFPVIAMIEGGVFGGACDLALTCDILMGTPTATFHMTPARIGVPYNASGLLHFINVLGVNTVKEMFFTGAPVDAGRALQLGLLNHVVSAEEIEFVTYALARRIAENSPLSIAAIKEVTRLLAGAHPLTPVTFERVQALRQMVYESGDYAEGIRAFNEKRKPVFEGKAGARGQE
jgi:methylmalonyl-CoA decarboxylase